MKLTEKDILTIVKQPRNKKNIEAAKLLQDAHKVHTQGFNYKSVIIDLGSLASDDDKKLMEKLLKPITPNLVSNIKSNLLRWANTVGSFKKYNFENTENSDKLSNILKTSYKGASIDFFVKNVLFNLLFDNFNGFVFIDKSKIEPFTPYITFVSIDDILDFGITGNKIEYIARKYPSTFVGDIEYKRYRVCDDAADYIVKVINDEVLIDESEPILKNELGYVPAIQISTILNDQLNDSVKTSPISKVISLLDTYAFDYSINKHCEKKHGFPKQYQFAVKCTHIHLRGTDHENPCIGGIVFDEEGNEITCPVCGGSGRMIQKNASDVMLFPESIPDTTKPYPLPAPIGYAQLDINILKYQIEQLEKLENNILYFGSGLKNLTQQSLTTATEVVSSSKENEEKNSRIAEIIETVETFITDCFGKYVFTNNYKGCNIYYGRKLNIRDESIINKEIMEGKQNGAPVSQIKALQIEKIISKYQNSKSDLNRNLLLAVVEPFVGYTIAEIVNNVYIKSIDKQLKFNFDELIKRFETDKGDITLFEETEPLNTRIFDIKTILTNYIKEDGNSISPENGQQGSGSQTVHTGATGVETTPTNETI